MLRDSIIVIFALLSLLFCEPIVDYLFGASL